MIQTSATQEVLNSKDFWRLRQKLESSGDIFEIDNSIIALYVGPDSDISELEVTYYDEQIQGQLQQAVISPGAPFVGRLDALLATTAQATGQPARILVTARDIVDQSYLRPTALQPASIVRIPTFIDLVGVFGNLITVPQLRSDRSFRSPLIPFLGTGFVGSTDIVFPVYNRRLVTVTVDVPPFTDLFASIDCVTLTPGANNHPVNIGTMTFPSLSVGATQTLAIKASAVGVYDLLIVNLSSAVAAGSASVTIRASDREG